MEAGALQAGVSELELKPELGMATGDGAPHAKGFLTPLFVKALVLTNGRDEVAVVSLDTSPHTATLKGGLCPDTLAGHLQFLR